LYNRQISTDVISRLDGIANSLMFDKRGGSAAPLQLRGLSTLTGGISRPLIIVDNFPYEGDINNLNPNDIESVTLLKDAAAASIWGARAGNGVIVLTTKKGVLNSRNVITLVSNLGIVQRPDLFYVPQMSSSDYIDIERFLFDKGVYNSALGDKIRWPVISPVVEILDKEKQGVYSSEVANSLINKLAEQDVRDDISRYFYRNAVNQQYNLQLSGGSAVNSYSLSAGYDRNLKNEVGNSYDRFTLRAFNSYRLSTKFQLDAGISFTSSKNTSNAIGEIRTSDIGGTLYPYAQLVDDSGNAMVLERNYRLGFVDTVGNGKLLDWHYRPYDELKNSNKTNRIQDFLFNLSAQYKLHPLLTASFKYQYHKGVNIGNSYQGVDSWYTRNLINRFTQVVGSNVKNIVPVGGIFDQSKNELQGHAIRGQIDFQYNSDVKHHLNAFLGGEVRQNTADYNSSRLYGYDPRYLTHQSVDYTNRYPIYGGLGSAAFIPYAAVLNGRIDRILSMYLNSSYTYLGRYMLTASARRDATNLFGAHTNNKWKPLWSLGVGWTISDEPFYNLSELSYLKLRATYGYTGNVNNSISALTTLSFSPMSSKTQLPYATVVNPPNPWLRWEQVVTWNVGFDLATKNKRLTASFEYYNKRSSDVISAEPADITSGFNRLTRNSAQLRNRGVDINVSSRNITGRFDWQTNAMLSVNNMKVEKYLLPPIRPSSMVGNGINISPIEGKGVFNLVSYRWAGLDPENGNPLGYQAGEVSGDYRSILDNAEITDLKFHGAATPKYFGALRNTLSLEGFSISFNLTFRFDYYFRRRSMSYLGLYAGAVGHGDYYKRWQSSGDELFTYIPSAIYPSDNRRDQFYRDAEVLVERADHIRLQDINLSYDFGQRIKKPDWLKSLSFNVYLSNLGVLWTKNTLGIDPDFNEMPLPKSYSFGIRARF